MKVRTAEEADIREIRRLVISLSGSYLDANQSYLPDWLAESLTVERFESRIASAEFLNRVALLNGKLAGYLSMKTNGHLYHLFVSKQHQGKGIARTLWEDITAYHERPSYSVRSSLNAVPVYKRFGFVEAGTVYEKEGVRFQPMTINRGRRY